MRESPPKTPKPLPAAAAFSASAEIAREAVAWLDYLAGERRASRHTLDGYGRDLRFFLAFLAEHLGALPDAAALKALEPSDLRAFLAKRRNDGLESRSLLRALAAVRAFLRFLEKKGLAKTDVFGAVRAPKRPHSLPKALAIADARDLIDQDSRAGEAREPWIFARDAAVLALLYGAGLRISEALSITRARAPTGKTDRVTILGKGGKTRTVPVIEPVRRAIEAYLDSARMISRAAHCSSARAAGRCRRASSNSPCSGCAARSACPTAPRRTPCAIPSPRISWDAAAICARSRNCSAMRRCRRRKSTPQWTRPACSTPIAARIRGRIEAPLSMPAAEKLRPSLRAFPRRADDQIGERQRQFRRE